MVSHNANLVVGADSEQIIVANNHGADRKITVIKRSIIYRERLKIADEKPNSAYILETCGMREHATDILDGGKEAFEKKKTSTR